MGCIYRIMYEYKKGVFQNSHGANDKGYCGRNKKNDRGIS